MLPQTRQVTSNSMWSIRHMLFTTNMRADMVDQTLGMSPEALAQELNSLKISHLLNPDTANRGLQVMVKEVIILRTI